MFGMKVSRETLSLMFGEVSLRLPVLEKVVLAPPFLMLIRFCGVSSPSYQMITEEELAELFGESPPGSPSQSPSRRIISGAADGVGDKVVAPIGVIDLTPGVRSPIYSE